MTTGAERTDTVARAENLKHQLSGSLNGARMLLAYYARQEGKIVVKKLAGKWCLIVPSGAIIMTPPTGASARAWAFAIARKLGEL